MAAVLFVFYLFLIIWSFGKLPLFRNSGLTAMRTSILFLIKLCFGLMMVLVYTYYYTDRNYADIYKYFDDGETIYESVGQHPMASFKVISGIAFSREDPEINEVLGHTRHFDRKKGNFAESNQQLIIRLNAALRFFSLGSIYIHCLFFCFLSFVGLMGLFRAFRPFFEDRMIVLMIPVYLLPSMLFWASGPLSESLIAFFLGLLVYTSFKLAEMSNLFTNLILSIICLRFLFLTKPFIAFAFLAAYYVMVTFNFRGYLRIISLLMASLFLIWFFYAHQTFVCGIMDSLIEKRNEFVTLGLKMKAGSLADEHMHQPTCLQPLRLVPSGFYNLFMQPFVWSKGLIDKLFGLENLSVLILTIFTLRYFKWPSGSKLQVAAFCFTFFLLNYLLIGITVPIIGALVRYKVFGMLFYMLLLICCVDLDKFNFIEKYRITHFFSKINR